MEFTGILLAAGCGRRFDPAGGRNKLLQAVAGDLIVAASARALLAVLPRVLAVVRPGAPEVARVLAGLGCEVHECAAADSGMGASLVHGLRAAADGGAAAAWIIGLGDMPLVRADTVRAVRDALAGGADIAAPVYQGRRGNPVGFSGFHRERLLGLSGDCGARDLLRAWPVREVSVEDPGVLRDVDTWADLANLQSRCPGT